MVVTLPAPLVAASEMPLSPVVDSRLPILCKYLSVHVPQPAWCLSTAVPQGISLHALLCRSLLLDLDRPRSRARMAAHGGRSRSCISVSGRASVFQLSLHCPT